MKNGSSRQAERRFKSMKHKYEILLPELFRKHGLHREAAG
jgi:hypothetical protein